ncbi:hypothetical protein V5F59_04590 [Xanthobacter autotrophicus DSM 431]|uniref:hypothetical protein n=1 Tax=Xanthobacter nonsaccharivorans TaxID=3119912 RepID=UPI00372AC535
MSVHKRTFPKKGAPKASGRPTRVGAPRRPVSAPEVKGAGKPAAIATYDFPAAGPHARAELMDPERTPGTGALPDIAHPGDGDSTE